MTVCTKEIRGCVDVCGQVHQAAIDLSLDVQDDAANHEPVFEAMQKMFAFLQANKDAFREAVNVSEGGQAEPRGVGAGS